jgi:tetratricopeptide (TPR) repeat protein
LSSVLEPAAYVDAVRSMVVDHPGDPLLMREFIRHLETQNPGVARDVWLKFLRELLLKGNLREVRQDILANVQVAGQSGDLLEVLRNLVVLEGEARDEGVMAEELIAQLRRKQANEQIITFCLSFLTKFPECVPALEALIEVYRAEGRSRQVADSLAALGVVRYWRGERELARQSFVAALDLDGRQSLAVSHLCDMLDEEGRLGRVPHDRRALMLQVYRVLGLYQPARRELERQLTETARDHEIHERIRELALETGHGDDVWECDFKMGGLRLKEGDVGAARGCYERGLAEAPDPAQAADRLRRVPGIHKVYSIAELAQAGRRAGQRRTESGGGAIDTLRRRVRDKNEE